MDRQPNSSRAKRSRFLVAADTNLDPHRLVRLCCERAGRETVSVSLLVPGDGEPRVRSAGPAAERLVRKATLLLDGAGVPVEDVVVAGQDNALVAQPVRLGGFNAVLVCADHQRTSSALLPFADRAGASPWTDGDARRPPIRRARGLATARRRPAAELVASLERAA